jgi:phage terminase Nu1 subunit (DNA packaging protein)
MEVNQAEFARIVGVSKPYITKLVKSGKLNLNANGKLNLEESQKILNTSKNPSFDANREHAKKQKGVPLKERVEKAQELKPEPKAKKQDLIDDEDTKDLDSENAFKINLLFNKARAAEKVALAKLRDIDVKIKKGELLDAEIVKKEAAEVGNLITQKLYNMVYKLAPLLVGIEDQKRSKEILESEVEIVLEELNRMSNEL